MLKGNGTPAHAGAGLWGGAQSGRRMVLVAAFQHNPWLDSSCGQRCWAGCPFASDTPICCPHLSQRWGRLLWGLGDGETEAPSSKGPRRHGETRLKDPGARAAGYGMGLVPVQPALASTGTRYSQGGLAGRFGVRGWVPNGQHHRHPLHPGHCPPTQRRMVAVWQ